MELQRFTGTAATEPCDCLVIGIDAEGQMSESGEAVDQAAGGWIARAFERNDVSGKLGEITFVPQAGKDAAAALLIVGLGPPSEYDRGAAYRASATAIRRLSDRQRERVVFCLTEGLDDERAEAAIAGAVTATAGQALYQTEPRFFPPQTLAVNAITQAALDQGSTLGDSINLTRHLVNEPPSHLFPESFAERARSVADECGMECEVWDAARLEAEGCQAILAVGRGSAHPPRLVKLTYRGGGSDEPSVALVGKGVTFDSGGLSLKPSPAMVDMKMDMAGAATVLGVIRCLALLKVPCNVVAYCGLAENMIDAHSYKLGDVIETRNGKTIEILNTDAEGRVVLADVLDVAASASPAAIVDVATLTGACIVALGTETVGMMGNDQHLTLEISEAAEQQGEWVWPLPMFKHFDEQVRSKVADLRNVGEGRWGGAITAAKFLEPFVGDVRWIHLDIAGPAFADSPKPFRDAGATGVMVRTLVRWLRQRSERGH